MSGITTELSNLGLKRITDFFVENMMCEAWRLANAKRLFKKGMTLEEKSDIFLSEDFQQHIVEAKPSCHPDIYYRNPFTEQYQHLFRVVDKELLMRPSFMANKVTGSVNMKCHMECDIGNWKINVSWSGLLKSIGKDACDLFM